MAQQDDQATAWRGGERGNYALDFKIIVQSCRALPAGGNAQKAPLSA
jgi:hypothetical protein